jgi:hypothetical protein
LSVTFIIGVTVTEQNFDSRKPVLYGPDNKPLPTEDSAKSSNESKLPKRRKSQQRADKTKRRISPLAMVLAAATLIGGVAALLALLPRVTVTASDPVNLDDPFSSSITITNTGYIPLYSLFPSVCLGAFELTRKPTLVTKRPEFHRADYEAHCMHLKEWEVRDLGLDDRKTIAINKLFDIEYNGASMAWADIAIAVKYEVPVIHLKREKLFPLVATRQSNGRLYWYSKPEE